MSATEELRRMLDEHGVEHKDFFDQTWWEDSGGAAYIAVETRPLDNNNPSTKLMLKRTATPEQAIAATLGSCNCTNDCTNGERTGTCEMEYVSDWMSWHCKSCDHMDMAPRNPKPRYCKWCGRKVVSE